LRNDALFEKTVSSTKIGLSHARPPADQEISVPLDADANKPLAPPGARMAAALKAALRSPNRVRQVGAVLAARDGTEISACNAFPAGVRDLEERHAGDGRFVWMEHAERHAIFEATRRGVATAGAHITSTFFPCIDCARAIVEAGIVCLDAPAPAFDDPVWGASFHRSQVILDEGGVAVRIVEVAAGR
jgi:dCMP deaminase